MDKTPQCKTQNPESDRKKTHSVPYKINVLTGISFAQELRQTTDKWKFKN